MKVTQMTSGYRQGMLLSLNVFLLEMLKKEVSKKMLLSSIEEDVALIPPYKGNARAPF